MINFSQYSPQLGLIQNSAGLNAWPLSWRGQGGLLCCQGYFGTMVCPHLNEVSWQIILTDHLYPMTKHWQVHWMVWWVVHLHGTARTLIYQSYNFIHSVFSSYSFIHSVIWLFIVVRIMVAHSSQFTNRLVFRRREEIRDPGRDSWGHGENMPNSTQTVTWAQETQEQLDGNATMPPTQPLSTQNTVS